jgi:5-methylcytosine-specific restriction enzyme B
MDILPVDTVFFARYTKSNYRALYKRFGGEPATYTKDYFQLADSTEEVLKRAFGFNGDPVDIEYVWPGGNITGQFLFSTDRTHLSWPTGGPEPWRVGDSSVQPVISIPGDSNKSSAVEADEEYDRIEKLGLNPWLIGVIVVGQSARLHLRVYFENPPEGFEDRRVSDLPKQIREAISALQRNHGTGAFAATPHPPKPRAATLVRQIEQALTRTPNVLLIGPPGTGKTVALEDLRIKYAASGDTASLSFDIDSWSATAFSESETAGERRSEALVFHPSYAYENFVAGLFPKSSAQGGIELEALPGPLLRMGHWVGLSERKALLILDEFNRGPAAAIFGDTLGLLDKEKRSTLDSQGAYIQRPYPDHRMGIGDDYASIDGGADQSIGKQISLPSGLAIVAAMNSTDRSVAPLDAAMRRRFHVIRVVPDYSILGEHFGLVAGDVEGKDLPSTDDETQWHRSEVLILAVRVLKSVNERVRFCLGDDFLLGHALLWSLADTTDETALRELSVTLDGFVISTLRTTFLDQDDSLAAVLGIPESATSASTDSGKVGYWQLPPAGLEQVASRRLALHSLSDLPLRSLLAALVSLSAP